MRKIADDKKMTFDVIPKADNSINASIIERVATNQARLLSERIDFNASNISVLKEQVISLNGEVGTKETIVNVAKIADRVTANETAISKRALQTDMVKVQQKYQNIVDVQMPTKADVSTLNAHISTSSNPHPNWKPTFANISGTLSGSRLDNSSVTYNKLASDVTSKFTSLSNSIEDVKNNMITNHNSLSNIEGGGSGHYYHLSSQKYNNVVKYDFDASVTFLYLGACNTNGNWTLGLPSGMNFVIIVHRSSSGGSHLKLLSNTSYYGLRLTFSVNSCTYHIGADGNNCLIFPISASSCTFETKNLGDDNYTITPGAFRNGSYNYLTTNSDGVYQGDFMIAYCLHVDN